MKSTLKKKALLSIFLLLFTFPAMAQFDDPEEGEDGENEPLNPAPIDDYIVPLLLAGVATGYYMLHKRKSVAK